MGTIVFMRRRTISPLTVLGLLTQLETWGSWGSIFGITNKSMGTALLLA
jgi:hypothetical protein